MSAEPRGLDVQTYASLVREHRDMLVALAWRVANDRDLAEDAVSEVFTRLWSKRNDLDLDRPVAYLARAVRNEVIDRIRRRDRERAAFAVASTEVRTAEPFGLVDDREQLDRLLDLLPAHHQRTIALRYLEDRTEAQTATALALPAGTVKSHASRAIRRMREAAA